MLQGIFFVSDSGEILLRKDFLYSSTKWSPETFAKQLKRGNKDLPSSVHLQNMFYFHIKMDSVLLVAVTGIGHMSAYIILEYLEGLADLLQDLLGTLSSQNISTNIGLVFELICESTNAGFPKLMNKDKMKNLLCNAVAPAKAQSSDFLSILPENLFGNIGDTNKRMTSSNATKKPVKIKTAEVEQKQELFVDLIEQLSVIVDANGGVLHYNIHGKLQVKSYLNCSSNLALTFTQNRNTADIFNKARFHSSVDGINLPKELRASIHPGTVTAVNYNVTGRDNESSLPFTIYTNIVPVVSDKLVIVNMKLHSSLSPRNPAVNFMGTMPLPYSTVTASGSCSLANVEFIYDRHKQVFRFTSPMYPGDSHHSISVKVLVKQWTPAMVYELNQVVLEFEAPMCCQSGLQISNLKVGTCSAPNDGVTPAISKWVRYITHSKSYEFYLRDDWLGLD